MREREREREREKRQIEFHAAMVIAVKAGQR